jgi:hypothetical protein
VSGSRQREWMRDILEGAPSILFLALWQSNVDIKFSGWAGAALAAIVLIAFRVFRLPYNPIVLGINIHLLMITPLIVAVFNFGAYGLGRTLFAFSHHSVLITIFFVGCALTVFSKRGFIGIDELPSGRRWAYSLALLAASVTTIAWSLTYKGPPLIALAIPIMVLVGLRRLLIARWLDRNGRSGGLLAVAPGSTCPGDTASEAT